MDHFVFFLRHIFGGDLVGSSWAGAGPFGGHCLFEGSAKEAEPQKLEKHRLPTIQPSIFFHLQKNMWISGRVYKWRKNRWLTCIMDSGHVPRLYWKTALFGKDRVCPFQPHFSTSSRWWFQWFFNVHPYLGFDDPIWVSHIFQVGWNSTTKLVLLQKRISRISSHDNLHTCFQDRRKVDHLVPRLEFWVYKWPRLESKEDEVEWCGDVWDEWVASGLQ